LFNGLKGVQRTFLRYYLYERHKTNKIGWHSRAKFYIWGLFYSLNYKSRYIALQYTKTKHLLCKAHINDKPAVLLIDTGASSSCIHEKLQQEFGLLSKGDRFDAAGASQGKMEAVMAQKCNLKIGRYALRKHSFVLLDMTHINTTLVSQGAKPIDGILGADFFRKHKALIDYKKLRLWL